MHKHSVILLTSLSFTVISALNSLQRWAKMRKIYSGSHKSLGKVQAWVSYVVLIKCRERDFFVIYTVSQTEICGFEKQRPCWCLCEITEVKVHMLHPKLGWQQHYGLGLHAFFTCHAHVQSKQLGFNSNFTCILQVESLYSRLQSQISTIRNVFHICFLYFKEE